MLIAYCKFFKKLVRAKNLQAQLTSQRILFCFEEMSSQKVHICCIMVDPWVVDVPFRKDVIPYETTLFFSSSGRLYCCEDMNLMKQLLKELGSKATTNLISGDGCMTLCNNILISF